MIESTALQVRRAEEAGCDLKAALRLLRQLTLDEFGELLQELPSEKYPNLSSLLPRSTPAAVQKEWTGASGTELLRQSVSFLNFVVANYADVGATRISRATVLDFGCGWGRLLRLMLYFVDSERLYGCDAWDSSLRHAREAKIPAHLAKSAVLPEELPFSEVDFDLIYAFSIFTHLSETVTLTALRAMRERIHDDGLLVITVRPIDFWDFAGESRWQDYSGLSAQHRERGFAFLPADPSADNPTYGDTSMSREYLESHAKGWAIAKMGRTLTDPYQVFLCLKPA